MLCQQSLTRMETTKVRSNSKTVSVSILQSLSIFICFVNSQHSGENHVLRNTVNDETSHSTLTETHNDLTEGLYMSPL